MNRFMKIAAPVAVIAVSVAAISALGANKPVPEKKEIDNRPVSLFVTEVRQEKFALSVTTQGEVRPRDEIQLVPQVSGRVVHVADNFGEGGSVSPGGLLVKIDDSNYKLAVTRAEARVAESGVRLEQELADARIKAKQWKDWVQDGEPTPLALNKPQVAEAQAKLRAAQADLAEAKLNLDRTRITVPFQGRIREKNVGLGQIASAGQSLGVAYATDLVEVRLPMSDEQMGDLGLPVGYQSGAYTQGPKVTFSATFGGVEQHWTGYIVRTDAAVDSSTRLFYATAQLKDPYGIGASNGQPMAVGLFVNANIKGRDVQDALIIPRAALRGKNSVYVVGGDNKLQIRTVTVVSTTSDNVIIGEGLKMGEKVVTSSVRSAVAGMDVTPIAKNKNVADAEDDVSAASDAS